MLPFTVESALSIKSMILKLGVSGKRRQIPPNGSIPRPILSVGKEKDKTREGLWELAELTTHVRV